MESKEKTYEEMTEQEREQWAAEAERMMRMSDLRAQHYDLQKKLSAFEENMKSMNHECEEICKAFHDLEKNMH